VKPRRLSLLLPAVLALCAPLALSAPAGAAGRNIVIFVADGLRAASLNAVDTPTMMALRAQGVWFANSHSLFPTYTTPNAAAIATGHYVGDTGDFGNALYTGYRLFNAGNFDHPPASPIPFIEDDPILGDLDDHFEGNFLGEDSFVAVARAHGYSTAAVGKLGPVALQDVTALQPRGNRFEVPQTLIIDDATGRDGLPLTAELAAALKEAGLPAVTPLRLQPAGDSRTPGVRMANWSQQMYFIEATTRAVLPLLKKRGQPFALVYWSRDPDGTQHNQGDSLNRLAPGINGPTSRAAVRHADEDLRQILDVIRSDPALAASTDVLVTSDHGFATIDKHEVDALHHATESFSAQQAYDDVPDHFLPPGFLAIDLAHFLGKPLFDPDSPGKDAHGNPVYKEVLKGHTRGGHGFIGGSGRAVDPTDADAVVVANGGSDLIYLPDGNRELTRRVVTFLSGLDYVGALFVQDALGPLPGALPFSSINLTGSARLPSPAIVVGFKTFSLGAREAGGADPLLNAVQIADTTLQQGQGMHGSLGRDNTFNVMLAAGPDFKAGYRDPLPASNADWTPTLLRILGWPSSPHGTLSGRVLSEALRDAGAVAAMAQVCHAVSAASGGRGTVLDYQRYDGRLYVDRAEFRALSRADSDGCRPAHP
jgi:arylsulfatase A-like enzyme